MGAALPMTNVMIAMGVASVVAWALTMALVLALARKRPGDDEHS